MALRLYMKERSMMFNKTWKHETILQEVLLLVSLRLFYDRLTRKGKELSKVGNICHTHVREEKKGHIGVANPATSI